MTRLNLEGLPNLKAIIGTGEDYYLAYDVKSSDVHRELRQLVERERQAALMTAQKEQVVPVKCPEVAKLENAAHQRHVEPAHPGGIGDLSRNRPRDCPHCGNKLTSDVLAALWRRMTLV